MNRARVTSLLRPARAPVVGVAVLAVAALLQSGASAAVAGPGVDEKISAYYGSQSQQWTSAVGRATPAAASEIADLRRTFTDAGLRITAADVTSRVDSRSSATSYAVSVTTRLTLSDVKTGEQSSAGFTVRRHLRADGAGRVVSDEMLPDVTPAAADTAGAPPNPSSAELPKNVLAGRADKGGGVQTLALKWPLNYSAMASYARAWTDSSALNPTYGDAGNNCANVASQSLDAGGWGPYQSGGVSRGSMNTWTYNMVGPYTFSYTWSRASYQERFMRETAQRTRLSNIWYAGLGDLLYTDWDPNLRPDGTIDHVMIVTGFTSDNKPRISQQTPWRNNIPLATSISIANSQGRTINWYGIRT